MIDKKHFYLDSIAFQLSLELDAPLIQKANGLSRKYGDQTEALRRIDVMLGAYFKEMPGDREENPDSLLFQATLDTARTRSTIAFNEASKSIKDGKTSLNHLDLVLEQVLLGMKGSKAKYRFKTA